MVLRIGLGSRYGLAGWVRFVGLGRVVVWVIICTKYQNLGLGSGYGLAGWVQVQYNFCMGAD